MPYSFHIGLYPSLLGIEKGDFQPFIFVAAVLGRWGAADGTGRLEIHRGRPLKTGIRTSNLCVSLMLRLTSEKLLKRRLGRSSENEATLYCIEASLW